MVSPWSATRRLLAEAFPALLANSEYLKAMVMVTLRPTTDVQMRLAGGEVILLGAKVWHWTDCGAAFYTARHQRAVG